MYKRLYNLLRTSRTANFLLHYIIESERLNRFGPYCRFYRKLINHRAGKWIMRPPYLEITVTDRCNSDCIMCPIQVHAGNTDIDTKLCYKIMDEAAAIGIRKIILTGGEPLLFSDIFDIIVYAKKIGFGYAHMFTNGSLLSQNNAERLMKAGLDSLTVSIDSNDKTEYEKIRRGLNYDEVINNIRNFRKWRDENGVKNPLFRLNRVNIPNNRNSAKQFVRELGRYADVVELIDAHNWSNKNNNELLAGALYGKGVRHPCNLLFQKIVVNPQGKFVKCSIDHNEKAIIGSARELSVKNAIEGRLAEIKRKMLEDDYSEPGCSECSYKQSWWVDWEV